MSDFVPIVYVHAPNGARLGRLRDVRTVARAFSRSGFESANFSVSTREPLLGELRPDKGNMIVVESTIYPLQWIGYVAQRRGDRASSIVEVTCDSLGSLLRNRTLPSGATYTGSLAHAFRDVVNLANGQAPTGVGLGDVSSGTATIPSNEPMTLGTSEVGDALDEIASVAGWEWWIDFEADAGSVSARANFAPWRGADLSSEVVLSETGQVDLLEWSEDMSRQSWAVTVVGGQQHAAQVIDDVPTARRTQLDAQNGATPFGKVPDALYDGSGPVSRREALSVIDSVKAQGLTETAAISELLSLSRLPPRRVRLALKNAPGLWQRIRPGDLVGLKLHSAFYPDGYDGFGRVEALQPAEEDGQVVVVFSLWRDRDASR